MRVILKLHALCSLHLQSSFLLPPPPPHTHQKQNPTNTHASIKMFNFLEIFISGHDHKFPSMVTSVLKDEETEWLFEQNHQVHHKHTPWIRRTDVWGKQKKRGISHLKFDALGPLDNPQVVNLTERHTEILRQRPEIDQINLLSRQTTIVLLPTQPQWLYQDDSSSKQSTTKTNHQVSKQLTY